MSINPQTSARSPRMIDPDTLMRIKGLELRAKVVVQGFLAGLHRSPYHGFSVEFSEYRQYTPGDDTRHVDWKLYARSDRVYIKRYQDETNLRCYLVVDASKSMTYGSGAATKSNYASTLAATLAYYLQTQRDAAGLMTFDEAIVDYIPARFRPGHLRRLMRALERPPSGTATDLERPLRQVADLLNKRGMIVLFTDLLADVDKLETTLGMLRSRGHEVVVFQVLDPAECDFEFQQPILFEDMESGREVYIDPGASRDGYLKRFADHNEQVREHCHRLGIEYHQIRTDQPLELALYDFLKGRLRHSRTVERAGLRGRRPGA